MVLKPSKTSGTKFLYGLYEISDGNSEVVNTQSDRRHTLGFTRMGGSIEQVLLETSSGDKRSLLYSEHLSALRCAERDV
jgi:hypothetical protein